MNRVVPLVLLLLVGSLSCGGRCTTPDCAPKDTLSASCSGFIQAHTEYGDVAPPGMFVGKAYLVDQVGDRWIANTIGGIADFGVSIGPPRAGENEATSFSVKYAVSATGRYAAFAAELSARATQTADFSLTGLNVFQPKSSLPGELNGTRGAPLPYVTGVENAGACKRGINPLVLVISEGTRVGHAELVGTNAQRLNASFQAVVGGAQVAVERECSKRLISDNRVLFVRWQLYRYQCPPRGNGTFTLSNEALSFENTDFR
jgi:hypothetical protein